MSPTIVLKDGKPVLVTGTPGGSRIISAVLQVIVNVIDYKMDVAAAVAAPRVHHQWMPDEVRVERGFPQETLDALKAKGHRGDRAARPDLGQFDRGHAQRPARRARSAHPRRGGGGAVAIEVVGGKRICVASLDLPPLGEGRVRHGVERTFPPPARESHSRVPDRSLPMTSLKGKTLFISGAQPRHRACDRAARRA